MNRALSYPMKLIAKNAGVSGSVLLKRWAIALPQSFIDVFVLCAFYGD